MKINHALTGVLGLILFQFPSGVEASLLVYEGFDYDAGTTLEGQDGGTGFGEVWKRRYSGNADQTIVVGPAFSDYPVSGNAVLFHAEKPGSNSACAIRLLTADFGAPPQPVWASYLFFYTVTPGKQPAYFGGMNTCNDSYPDDRRFGVSGLTGSNHFGACYQSPEATGSSATNSPSTTYLLIGKYVGGEGMTMWVLSAANYDAIKAGGITEEKLDATNSGKAIAPFTDGKDTALQDYLSIAGTTFGDTSSLDVTFDELKLGTTLSDVVSPPPKTAP